MCYSCAGCCQKSGVGALKSAVMNRILLFIYCSLCHCSSSHKLSKCLPVRHRRIFAAWAFGDATRLHTLPDITSIFIIAIHIIIIITTMTIMVIVLVVVIVIVIISVIISVIIVMNITIIITMWLQV